MIKSISLMIFIFMQTQDAVGVVLQGSFEQKKSYKYGLVVEPHLKQNVDGILTPALSLVQVTIKDRIQISPLAKGDDKFDFIIQITDRSTALAQDQGNEALKMFTKNINGDAFSIFLSDQPGSPVIVRVLWDEAILYEVNNEIRARPDAFARLVTLLGHEISGNVENFLSRRSFYESPEFQFSEKVRAEEYLRSEVRAFTAGVKFLEDLISQFGNKFSPKLKQDFRAALERENKLLEAYISRQKSKGSVVSIDFTQAISCGDTLR